MATKQIAIVAGVLAAIVSASASADILNVRPYNPGTLGGLDTLLDSKLSPDIDAVANQSAAAVWSQSEADAAAYLISIVTGAGKLGIYSYANPSKELTFTLTPTNSASFQIIGGTLVSGATLVTDFGDEFGFYLEDTTGGKVYTEDSKNGGNVGALAYQLDHGTKVLLNAGILGTDREVTVKSGDDFVLAFDNNTGATDFADGVFLIEDIQVPEPTSIALMALGLVGVTMVARRRSNKGVSLQFA